MRTSRPRVRKLGSVASSLARTLNAGWRCSSVTGGERNVLLQQAGHGTAVGAFLRVASRTSIVVGGQGGMKIEPTPHAGRPGSAGRHLAREKQHGVKFFGSRPSWSSAELGVSWGACSVVHHLSLPTSCGTRYPAAAARVEQRNARARTVVHSPHFFPPFFFFPPPPPPPPPAPAPAFACAGTGSAAPWVKPD